MGSKVSYQASFVGYFPADEPRYSCIVVVNSPTSDVYHGNRVAGPVFLEIANKAYATSLDMQKPINTRKTKIDNNLVIPYSKSGYQAELSTALKNLDVKKVCDNPKAKWVTTEKKEDYVELKPRKVIDNLVPNVESMGLKDAVYLLENIGLRVVVIGRGSVRSQSISAGTKVHKGDRIKLVMSFTEG
jgi:cell division protein FtsI (penicillin-binding protein 3)